jgi:predicted glycogen debranching enzyme
MTASDLDESTTREWLVADGVGGYAMGTVSGLRTRRYHGLLVIPSTDHGQRNMALAALDAVVIMGDQRHRLATHEWADGTIDPEGGRLLSSFSIIDGVPRWRWVIGDVIIEREVAMTHGRSAVGIVHRVVRAPRPVELELHALVTWRDAHRERIGDRTPTMATAHDGFVFESAVQMRGPGFEPIGEWYRGVKYRVEAARGLNAIEDLFCAGRFVAVVDAGAALGVEAWPSGDPPPPAASLVVDEARERARGIARQAGAADPIDSMLAHAADQFIVAGPDVIAGYPWFGTWSRDTLTAYEGLFLATGRSDEGGALLTRLATTISEGMLANTADTGRVEYNTVDAALWYLHAVCRHVEVTGDLDLGCRLQPAMSDVVESHLDGTRYGIGVDPRDGLIRQGAEGVALTWMDARIDGVPVTPRVGKPVEVNALWANGLAGLALLRERLGLDAGRQRSLAERARRSFVERFVTADGLIDVVDGPDGDDRSLRPSQLLAVSLPHGPYVSADVVRACGPLVTPLGLRSLASSSDAYRGRHQGSPRERDLAYHQGTVWPWLLGPYVEAAIRTGVSVAGVLDGLIDHLTDAGMGSVSETADGDPPHVPTGCPFQAWSVAELIRVKRLVDHEAAGT